MLVHLDGFDSYTTAADLMTEYGGAISTINLTAGRFGGGAVSFGSSSNALARSLATATTELWVGYAIKPTSIGSAYDGTLLVLSSATGTELAFCVAAGTGAVNIHKGTANGTILATLGTTTVFTSNAWHWLEFRYKYGASVGAAEFWIDGVQFGTTFTGNTTSAGGGSIILATIGSAAYTDIAGYIDDLYIVDVNQAGVSTGRLGDCRIATLVPTGNAGPNNGTPSAGNAYACVNEAQWNSSNYVTLTNTPGQEELYTMGALPTTPASVFGVRVLAVAEKSDAGAAALYPSLKSGTHDTPAAAVSLLTAWGRAYGLFETDPNTSAAWAAAAVNAMACGVKVV